MAETVLDYEAIKKIIPHRYPFLLIDKVIITDPDKTATGIKCVSGNELFFQGHFPERAIMPGVLIVEAMAQVACALFLSKPEFKHKLAFFMGMEEIKFRRPVVPGDRLELKIELIKMREKFGKAQGKAFVDNEIATEATLYICPSRQGKRKRMSIPVEQSAPTAPKLAGVHPTAIIHPSAKIASEVEIGPYAVIGEDVVIHPGVRVGPHAVVEFAEVGQGAQIHAGAFVGTAPQDLKYRGERTRLELGAQSIVRECATLNRGTGSGGVTRIGSRCLFMAYSHVAHDCVVGNEVILGNCTALAGHVEIGDGAILSGLCGVHQFVRIGKYVMVSGGSKIGLDVAPFTLAQGDRASLRGINTIGLRRRGFKSDDVAAIKRAYRALFGSTLPFDQTLSAMLTEEWPAAVIEMLSFLKLSKRGVCRPSNVTGDDETADA